MLVTLVTAVTVVTGGYMGFKIHGGYRRLYEFSRSDISW